MVRPLTCAEVALGAGVTLGLPIFPGTRAGPPPPCPAATGSNAAASGVEGAAGADAAALGAMGSAEAAARVTAGGSAGGVTVATVGTDSVAGAGRAARDFANNSPPESAATAITAPAMSGARLFFPPSG